jgi:hypothetical protein
MQFQTRWISSWGGFVLLSGVWFSRIGIWVKAYIVARSDLMPRRQSPEHVFSVIYMLYFRVDLLLISLGDIDQWFERRLYCG